MALFCSGSDFSKTRKGNARKKSKRSKPDGGSTHYGSLEPRQLLATIVWSSGDITGNSDVSTNGTSVFAINASSGTGVSTIVNSVSFVTSTRANASGQAQGQSPGNESLNTTIANDNGNSFENGGLGGAGDVGGLIQGGWWGSVDGDPATITLTGLSVGNEYELQIFANDARSGRDDGFVTRLGDGNGGTGIELELNNQPNGGSAGDFGIGTFTADGSTQTIELLGFLDGSESPSRIQVNAIQLRNIEPVELLPGAVPLINEFAASNANIIDDDNGNSTDFIEIFNAGEDALNLAGYSLTDDPADTSKYVFPNTPLAGGQYLVVFAGDDADPTSGEDLYTGFGLSSSGEYLGFYDSAGNLVSEFGVGGSNYPAQFSNVSYGLVNDGNYDTPAFFTTPTPGSGNNNAVDGVIDALPTVSVDRGFYDQAFDVGIASQTPGASVVYTTDGSEPTLTNGTRVDPSNANSLVSFTLNIAETTSLRTAVVRDGFATRGSTTHSYVFLNDVIASDVLDTAITNQYTNDELRAGLLDIPTLSFNYETVIRDSDQPEQRASIEWLAPDGSEGFQINAGISGFGGNHISSQGFEKENFRVEFRSEYDGRLNFPLFEGFDNGVTATDSFESVEFRGGSHDRILRGFGLSNRFVDDTLLELGHAVPHGRFVHVYSNGEYFGQFHMRERWDADFLAQYYGGDEDDYEAVVGNANNRQSTPNGWSPGRVYDGEGLTWETINALADTDGSGNPTGGYQELKGVVNLPQYIDYLLLYMSGDTENEYRAGGSADGSVGYTFFLNDADGWLRPVGDRTGDAGPGNIFGTLVDEADPEFMTLLSDRIENLFGEGGVLSPERSVERLQNRIDETQLSFVLESARYSATDETRTPQSFFDAANNAINNILPALPGTMISRLRARGLFPDLDSPSFEIDGVFQNGGEIESGDLLTLDANETVYYTTDGSDPRLVGGGINQDAILYDPSVLSTTIFTTGEDWRFLDDGSDQGTAWRTASFDDNSWASGPSDFGYGDGNDGQTTEVEYGNDEDNKHITTYFRNEFNVPAGNHSSFTLNLIIDDGAVVYLNGTEILRDNLPTNQTISYDTEAENAVGGSSERTFRPFTFSDPAVLALLQTGSNTIAVEIHQAAPDSSDISFDARLTLSTQLEETEGIPLTTSTNIQARTFDNGEWSGLRNATFAIPASQSDLRITEINYNPAEPSAAEIGAGFIDSDDFEFIEIFNPSTTGSINLAGVQLAEGVTFQFGNVDLLPGERAVVVEDIAAFQARYGTSITVLGQWSGGLSNSGERVDLLDSSLNEIMSVNYGDNDPWDFAADGLGFTLVLDDPFNTPVEELGRYFSWRASSELGGTPGAGSASPSGIVINEILAHTDPPQSDSIELFNPTNASIDVSGWFLSDNSSNLLQFQIPSGTVIAAGGYLVFDESDFNPTPLTPNANDFALSSEGDQVYLARATAGVFDGLEDSVAFGATFNGESLGLSPDGSGLLVRLAQPTLGSANSQGLAGPLVISEANYHPSNPSSAALAIDPLFTDDDLEFVEIFNPTSASIDLTNWRIRGDVDFDFAASSSLGSGESLVLVSFDPNNTTAVSAFETHYGISGVDLVGPWIGGLSNGTGRVSLQAPDDPSPLTPTEIPHVVVDELLYDDLSAAFGSDGDGFSLNRIADARNGNDPNEFLGDFPTPGSVDLPSAAPTVVSFVRDGGSIARPDLWTTLDVTFSSDVAISASALQLFNDSTGGNLVDLSGIGFSYNSNSRTATWDFSTLLDLDAAFYTATLDANSVTGSIGGQALDGDGNGTAGGDFLNSVYVAIPGDANLDGTVNVLGDAFSLVSNLGSTVNIAWANGNFNGDGVVNVLGDAFALISNLGRSVLPPSSSAQFVSTPDEPVNQAVLLAETTEIQNASDEPENAQAAPIQSSQPYLSGSQVLDEAFASDDWLI